MRADMGKVLVERPRVGRWRSDGGPVKGYRKRVRKLTETGDGPPAREGIKVRSGGTKFFNEHLGPLRRFLNSNVGRPWDKVYSEICEFVDRGNVVQKHILTHLFDYVVTQTVLIDGEPCDARGGHRRYSHPLRTSDYRHQWYVCPKSGLLRRSQYVPRERKPKPPAGETPPAYIWVGDRAQVRWAGGGWELVEVAPLPRVEFRWRAGWDAVLGTTVQNVTEAVARNTYGRPVYAVSRRQLARKELKDYPIPMRWWG